MWFFLFAQTSNSRCHFSKRAFRIWLVILIILTLLVFISKPVLVQYYVHKGKAALKSRDFAVAIQSFSAAQDLDTSNPDAYFWLARSYRRAGKVNQVRALLDQAESAGFPKKRLQREWWLTLAQSGRISEAEPNLANMLLHPGEDGAEICEAFVHGYRLNLRFAEATRLLDVWQADFPDDPEPYFQRGMIAEMTSQWKLASEEYQTGLKMTPSRTKMRYRLAQALLKLHEAELAEAHLKRCQQELPEDFDIRLARADALSLLGAFRRARTLYLEILEKEPTSYSARRGLGRLELEQGDPFRAVEILQPLVEEWPGNVETRYFLIRALTTSKKKDEAENHSQIHQKMFQEMERLEDLFSKVVDRADDLELRHEIGTLLLRHHSREKGLEWLKSVLQIEPNHQKTHLTLAAYYESSGKTELAKKHRAYAGE